MLLVELDGSSQTNTRPGLAIMSTNCTVRGLVVNRFPGSGINVGEFLVFGISNNVVEGNFIGTDVTGTSARTNGSYGVYLTTTPSNRVGGTNPAARNLISGNSYGGIYVNSGCTATTIHGNFIGTDVTGTNALPNGSGVYVLSSGSVQIGDAVAGAGNVISGNTGDGIALYNTPTQYTQVKGNWVGTDMTGKRPVGNGGAGVRNYDVPRVVIGDDGPNIIAFNNVGVIAQAAQALNAPILSNSIFSNKWSGIVLGSGSIGTANDECDADNGPNLLQNYPALTNAVTNATSATISGVLDSVPSTAYRLQFFANLACDASGSGEGQIFIGETALSAGGTCSNGFVVVFPIGEVAGRFITVTATDPDGNTSQFSNCIEVPIHPDADGDGLPSVWEIKYGLDPFSGAGADGPDVDRDGDGLTNGEEFLAGTDPTDPQSRLAIIWTFFEGPDVRIAWRTAGGRTNQVQASTVVATNEYVDVSPPMIISGTGDAVTNYLHIGATTNVPSLIYRVRLVP